MKMILFFIVILMNIPVNMCNNKCNNLWIWYLELIFTGEKIISYDI